MSPSSTVMIPALMMGVGVLITTPPTGPDMTIHQGWVVPIEQYRVAHAGDVCGTCDQCGWEDDEHILWYPSILPEPTENPETPNNEHDGPHDCEYYGEQASCLDHGVCAIVQEEDEEPDLSTDGSELPDVQALSSLTDRLERAADRADPLAFRVAMNRYNGLVRLSSIRRGVEILGVSCANGLFAFIPVSAQMEGELAATDQASLRLTS